VRNVIILGSGCARNSLGGGIALGRKDLGCLKPITFFRTGALSLETLLHKADDGRWSQDRAHHGRASQKHPWHGSSRSHTTPDERPMQRSNGL